MENNNEDHTNGYANYPNLDEQLKDSSEKEKSSMEVSPTSQESPSTPQVQETDFDFWKVNSYKKTVRRVDDGAKLADDVMKMVSERAEIESQYSLKLQSKYFSKG